MKITVIHNSNILIDIFTFPFLRVVWIWICIQNINRANELTLSRIGDRVQYGVTISTLLKLNLYRYALY